MMSRLYLIFKEDLPHRAVAVYMYLDRRANQERQCWPAIPTIARELKMSESTVKRALHDLEKSGYICREQRYRECGGKSSLLFTLIRPA